MLILEWGDFRTSEHLEKKSKLALKIAQNHRQLLRYPRISVIKFMLSSSSSLLSVSVVIGRYRFCIAESGDKTSKQGMATFVRKKPQKPQT